MAARAAHSIYFDGTCLAQSPRVLFLRLIFLLLLLRSSRALLPISPPPVCSSPYTHRCGPVVLAWILPPVDLLIAKKNELSAIDVVVERFRFVTTRDQSLGRRPESWPLRIGIFVFANATRRRPRPSARDMNVRTLYNDKSINPARGKKFHLSTRLELRN